MGVCAMPNWAIVENDIVTNVVVWGGSDYWVPPKGGNPLN